MVTATTAGGPLLYQLATGPLQLVLTFSVVENGTAEPLTLRLTASPLEPPTHAEL